MSRQRAISRFCRSCIYDPNAAGTWRAQVAACTTVGCPLHPYRPMPRMGLLSQQNDAIPATSGVECATPTAPALCARFDAKTGAL
jgi:hypothetical protein